MESMQKEIQDLKKRILHSMIIYVITVIIYNFTLIQCILGYSRVQNYYQETRQLNQELSETLETVYSQCRQIAEDYEEFQQILRQK